MFMAAGSAGYFQPPDTLRIAPIDPVAHLAKL